MKQEHRNRCLMAVVGAILVIIISGGAEMTSRLKIFLNNRRKVFAFATSSLTMLLALSSFAIVAQADQQSVDGASVANSSATSQTSTGTAMWIDTEINKALHSGRSAFLYFYADWCPFCQKQKPIVDELEQKYYAAIAFIRVNGSDEPQAMDEFGVTVFPTMFFISGKAADGEYVYQQYCSFTDEETLKDEFNIILGHKDEAVTVAAARTETLCSYAGPDTAPDWLQLTDFKVMGQTPLKVGDTITVSFKLLNASEKDINLGAKGIFVGATDPNNGDASFGSTYPQGRQATLAVRQALSIQASRTLDKPGNWTVWPSYQLATAARQIPKFGPSKWHACSLTVQSSVVSPPVIPPPVIKPPITTRPAPSGEKETVNISFPDGITKPINLPNRNMVPEGPIGGMLADAFEDDDHDGVQNFLDECPNTPDTPNYAALRVYDNGCRCRDGDGGINPYVKGTVYNMTSSGEEIPAYNGEDECATSELSGEPTYILKEKYCNPEYETGQVIEPAVKVVKIKCPICGDGNCTIGPCTSRFDTNCADKLQNQDETGVDCGGKCPSCNTKCTTGTLYAPPDTPCTTGWPNDPHKVNYNWTDSDHEFNCRYFDVCNQSLDNEVIEALKCCSATTPDAVDSSARKLCKEVVLASGGNCKKCVGLYLIKGLGTYARWMKGYKQEWYDNGDPTYPPTTAGFLLDYYKTGICRHYALALTTLLRKAGYTQQEVSYFCDGPHCYNIVKFPGDKKYHVVDTTGNGQDITLGGLPGSYPYCINLDESRWWYDKGGGLYTGPIPDVNAYWDTVSKGQQYTYWTKGTTTDMANAQIQGMKVVVKMDFLPDCGPGVAYDKDNYRLPDYAPLLSEIIGCGGP